NGCHKGKYNWKNRIAVFKNKPLNLCDIEYYRNHNPEHVRKKLYRMAKVIRKEIASRSTNATPSMLATAESVAISKQYGIKNMQDSKEQAVLLGIVSTIMPMLLTKYLDLFAIDSTGSHNCLNFLNTAFIVRSDKPHSQIIATFISDRETIPVIGHMFESRLKNAFQIRKQFYMTGMKHAAAKLDNDDVQHAAAELDDDELDDNDIQHAAAELDNNDISKESSRLSKS
ncbi:6218_t:CDS:2, partial [Racocetra persica]